MIDIAGFRCRLVRSDRKTLRLTVSVNGTVTVSAPKKASLKQITDFVTKNTELISSAVARQRSKHDSGLLGDCPESPFLDYKGRKCPVHLTKTDRATFNGDFFTLPENATVDEQRRLITELYRPLAKEYITQRAEEISAAVGIRYKRLRFAQSTSRWGSRSSSGTVSFSVYLIGEKPDSRILRAEIRHIRPGRARDFGPQASPTGRGAGGQLLKIRRNGGCQPQGYQCLENTRRTPAR